MKNLNFSFIDIFSYSKKEKKKLRLLNITIFHESTAVLRWRPPWPRNGARSNQFLPLLPFSPLQNPFKRRKSLSHLITGPGSELTDVLTFTPSLVQISPRHATSPPTSTLIRIHGYHFMPDLMSRIN